MLITVLSVVLYVTAIVASIGTAAVIVYAIITLMKGDSDGPFIVVQSRQVARPPQADALYDGIYDSFVEKGNEGDDRR